MTMVFSSMPRLGSSIRYWRARGPKRIEARPVAQRIGRRPLKSIAEMSEAEWALAFPNEDTCIEWLVYSRWPQDKRCAARAAVPAWSSPPHRRNIAGAASAARPTWAIPLTPSAVRFSRTAPSHCGCGSRRCTESSLVAARAMMQAKRCATRSVSPCAQTTFAACSANPAPGRCGCRIACRQGGFRTEARSRVQSPRRLLSCRADSFACGLRVFSPADRRGRLQGRSAGYRLWRG